MTVPLTTLELAVDLNEEMRQLRFREAALILAIRIALKHLKRNEITKAENVLRGEVNG